MKKEIQRRMLELSTELCLFRERRRIDNLSNLAEVLTFHNFNNLNFVNSFGLIVLIVNYPAKTIKNLE
jgi:hypothetical protein